MVEGVLGSRATLYGHLAAISAPFAVGVGVAISGLLVGYPVLASQGARYLIGAVVIGILLRRRALPRGRLHARHLALLALDVVVGLGLFSVATIEALRDGTAAGVGVIVGLAPIAISLVNALLERRRPSRALLVGTVVATLGAIVVNGAGAIGPAGALWALVALASDATFTLASAPLVAAIGPFALTFLSTALAGAGLLVTGVLAQGLPPAPSMSQLLADVAIALIVTVGAFLAWFAGLGALGVARAAPYVALIPVGALLGGLALGTTPFGSRAAAGVAMVALGLIIAQLPARVSQGAAPA